MIPTWLLSPIAKRIGIGIAIAIATLALRAHFVEVGRLKGEASATQRTNEFLVTNQATVRQQTVADNAERDKRIDQLAGEIEQNRAQFTQLIAAISTLARQQAQASAAVDKVKDSDLLAYNVEQLHLRDPTDQPNMDSKAHEPEKKAAKRPRGRMSLEG